MTESRPPFPPFNLETARQKVQIAEDGWNTRDPEKVALTYAADSAWRDRGVHLTGRPAIIDFLTRKWQREQDYALRQGLWGFRENRMAVRLQYEWHDNVGQWWRSYGNELWEFAPNGLMIRREASINDHPIEEAERRILGPRQASEHAADFPIW